MKLAELYTKLEELEDICDPDVEVFYEDKHYTQFETFNLVIDDDEDGKDVILITMNQ